MSFLQGLFGPPNFEKMKAERDLKGLIKVLAYSKDSRARQFAADALGQIGDPAAVEPLITALAEKDPVRRHVAAALGQIGDPRAGEALVATFENWYEIPEVTLALGQIGDQRAAEPLIQLVKDDPSHYRKGFLALGKLKKTNTLKPLLEIAGAEQPWSHWALESARMIEPNLDEKKLSLVSCWSTVRTNVYTLRDHNEDYEESKRLGCYRLPQTYEHAGRYWNCPACERLIQKHIESELKQSVFNRSMPIGYELNDGILHTYYLKNP
jgi:hypothetical protein